MIKAFSSALSKSIAGKLTLPSYRQSRLSFGSLKGGCLLLGIGLGLLVGFFVCIETFPHYFDIMMDQGRSWEIIQVSGIVYGSCVLLFGGIGLLVAFLIEMKLGKKKDNE